MASTESLVCETLDLSCQGLKKISRCPSDADISTLIIDDNELQRLDNLDSYHRITKLSIVRNQLLRMYGVSKLHNLVTLNLANNGILTIEGIKDMTNLQTLCLAGNNIKSIEHLHTNIKLEHLDLSENSISHISDISYLRNLKELFLHNNRIITLRQCERYLPTSLETFTLANNNITDLNEMSHLTNLKNLVNFSIANNPCVVMTGNSSSRNSLRIRSPDRMIASCHTDPMVSSCHTLINDNHESLMTQSLDPNMLCSTLNNKAGNMAASQTIEETSSPLQAATKLVPVPESLMSPDFRPPSGLSRILPKTPPSKLTSPCQITMPSKPTSDGDGKAIPIINTVNPMAKTNLSSVKANALVKSNSATNCSVGKPNIAKPIVTNANKCPHSVKINNYVQSKTLPVKRSTKNSPNLGRNIQRAKSANDRIKSGGIKKSGDGDAGNATQSSDEDSEVCQAKLDGIRHRAIQRRQEDNNKDQDEAEKAAICIQRMWRGYHTRNLNKKATNILKAIEMTRTNKYIQKLSTDMEATRTALESEHKLQLLQMQAINALWKKVVSLQPSGNRDSAGNDNENITQNADVVTNLAQTCNLLHTQVQQLQDSMSEIKRCMSNMQSKPILIDNGVATQTEISAVHTPAGEENTFPYARAHRPQTLPIHQTIHEGNENRSFASNLIDSVLKKVSQSTDTTDDEVNTDILNSNENPELLNSNEHPDMFKSCEEIVESDFRDVMEHDVKNEYDVIENTVINGEVCEETLCKELHHLIETEITTENCKNVEKEDSSEEVDREEL
ncbi:uncharacterized protein LOC128887680 isoform X3 [Hylaeus anthracinus]|uniref:uncharacterized protein LOC128874417 isoform X3 n=1 Tax=Hylaeus volcanicus TaxID=313075 RepID=UPI0023B82172|nr:uncharacterized protein LOC128874417 isoform X3 [Hylaeus volcanicus]XP_053999826.1 uncharacterized protein LOC128887680 isoform X3 [Hylaeus anthracinus]